MRILCAALVSILVQAAPALATPSFVSTWGSGGTGPGQFDEPRGLATDSAGNVYVADSQNHRIQKFTGDGTFITQWGTAGSGQPGLFQSPTGIAVDGGSVYVADRNNNRIQKFDLSGTFVDEWGSLGQAAGQFNHPNGVAVDGQGGVYVADFDNRRVQKFTSDGTFLLAWGWDVVVGGTTGAEVCRPADTCKVGQPGTGDTQFTLPEDVATDCSNNVYVVDGGVAGGPIQKFDSNATFLTRWGGTAGSGPGEFNNARGITVGLASGTVLIADAGNRRVQRFDLGGAFIDTWGSLGTGNGQFTAPYDVAVGTGGIYVSDSSLHRIQRFTEGGGACGAPPPSPTVASPSAGKVGAGTVQLTGVVDTQGLQTTWYFEYGPTIAYGSQTPFATLAGAATPQTVTADVAGLQSNTTYHYRLRASNSSGESIGEDRTFTTAKKTLADLPPPVLGETTNVEPVSGEVLVALPAGASAAARGRMAQKGLDFVPLEEARQIPVGSFLDTGAGRVRLQSASGSGSKTQTGEFFDGLFQVLQSRTGAQRGLTELRLKGSSFRSCRPAGGGKRAATARKRLSKQTIRKLGGSASGKFRTRGRHSSATVRGTIWTTVDRCDGTLTKVRRGRVAVRDFRRKRTIIVRAGKSYLAHAAPTRRTPSRRR